MSYKFTHWSSEFLPTTSDGRAVVTREMAQDQPHVGEMVQRTSNFWEQDPINQDVWIANEPGEIAVRIAHREWTDDE
jgi:hypothetical protein